MEVTDEAEALRWIAAGADVVQLEKFSPEAVARVVRQAAPFGTRIAAAGGIHAGNAAAARDVAVRLEGGPTAPHPSSATALTCAHTSRPT
jgi:molybdenum transport protein